VRGMHCALTDACDVQCWLDPAPSPAGLLVMPCHALHCRHRTTHPAHPPTESRLPIPCTHPSRSLEVLQAFWEAAQRSMQSGADGSASTLSQDGHRIMLKRIYRVMIAKYDETEADEAIAEDWERDAKGAEALTRRRFQDAFFELADTWTRGICAYEYAAFLWRLYEQVTVQLRDENGTRIAYIWKEEVDCVHDADTYGDGDDDDEGSADRGSAGSGVGGAGGKGSGKGKQGGKGGAGDNDDSSSSDENDGGGKGRAKRGGKGGGKKSTNGAGKGKGKGKKGHGVDTAAGASTEGSKKNYREKAKSSVKKSQEERSSITKIQAIQRAKKDRQEGEKRKQAIAVIQKNTKKKLAAKGKQGGGDGAGEINGCSAPQGVDGSARTLLGSAGTEQDEEDGKNATGTQGTVQYWALRKGLPSKLQEDFDSLTEEEKMMLARLPPGEMQAALNAMMAAKRALTVPAEMALGTTRGNRNRMRGAVRVTMMIDALLKGGVALGEALVSAAKNGEAWAVAEVERLCRMHLSESERTALDGASLDAKMAQMAGVIAPGASTHDDVRSCTLAHSGGHGESHRSLANDDKRAALTAMRREREVAKARAASLQRGKAAGNLTAAEAAELAALMQQIEALDRAVQAFASDPLPGSSVGVGSGGDGSSGDSGGGGGSGRGGGGGSGSGGGGVGDGGSGSVAHGVSSWLPPLRNKGATLGAIVDDDQYGRARRCAVGDGIGTIAPWYYDKILNASSSGRGSVGLKKRTNGGAQGSKKGAGEGARISYCGRGVEVAGSGDVNGGVEADGPLVALLARRDCSAAAELSCGQRTRIRAAIDDADDTRKAHRRRKEQEFMMGAIGSALNCSCGWYNDTNAAFETRQRVGFTMDAGATAVHEQPPIPKLPHPPTGLTVSVDHKRNEMVNQSHERANSRIGSLLGKPRRGRTLRPAGVSKV